MKHKLFAALSLAVIVAMVVTSLVVADDVANNIDTSVDATYETISLVIGGAPRQVDLYTVNRNGDGKNGCNLTGQTELKINVTSSMPSIATVSPSQITFTACESVNANLTTAVTVTPVSAGSTNITFSLVSNDSGGSFNLDTARFTVEVAPPPNTPPVVSVTGVTGGANYEHGSVPAAGCSVTDAEDGPQTVSPVVGPVTGPLSAYGLGSQEVTCSYTDTGGLTVTASATYAIVDTHAPALTLPTNITAEATSADGAQVSFVVTASDAVDSAPDVTCMPASGSTFDFGTTTVNCSAADVVGNTSNGSFTVTVQDTTPPVIATHADVTEEATGPSGAVVYYEVPATSDAVDGHGAATCAPASGSQFALGGTTVYCDTEDAAGNHAVQTSFVVHVVDTTPPVIAAHADVTEEATGPSGAVVNYEVPSTSDAVDGTGTATCAPASGSQFALGDTTVYCDAEDAAHNHAIQTSFIVYVVDTTPPVITYVDRTPANGYGWNNSNVTVNWNCTDLVGVVSASISQTISSEGENQSVTGTCEDTSGNTASNTQSGINIDKTSPTASASRTPDANSFGWNNTDVTVSFSGTDELSGIASCSADITFSEGAGQSASGTCTDKADNESTVVTIYDINVDKTSPTITGEPDRSPNGNGWYNADVTVTFTCNDALSGVDACAAPVTLHEGAGQSASGSGTDKAGNSANFTVSGINIDKTAPTISAALDKAAINGWFNIATGAPTVNFTCDDALSGLDGNCPAPHLFADGADQAFSQTIYDLAGNSASAGVSDVNVDTLAPGITAAISPTRPASGWWNIASGAPTVTYTCTDETSGIASCTTPYTFPEGENQGHNGTAIDEAGNSASANVSDIDIDLTAPILTWNGGPADGASYYFGSVPAAPTCIAADDLSGPDGCTVSGYALAVGQHTITATAHDKAGNSQTETRTYTVMAWTIKGFYQPVDMNGVLNTVKGGSTVPLKFEVFAGPTELTDTAIVSTLLKQVTCNATIEDTIEVLATGGTSLRYDTVNGQFIFNWQTPKLPGKCYSVTLTTQDGSSITAFFKLK